MKLKTILLILTTLIYVPILLFTIFVIGISGIDNSCRFNDLNCLMSRPADLWFDITLYLLNIGFILGIIWQSKKIIKLLNKEEAN